MALEQFKNAPVISNPALAWTTLSASINSSVTTLTVVSAANFPSAVQFRIAIDDELMLVTAVAGTTWTVTRAIEGTTAASHADGASVYHIMTAASFLRNPRSMTSIGDMEYLDSSLGPARLAAGADGTYIRYSGGIPSASVLSASDLASGTVPLARISGLTTTQFSSANVSQWTNDSGYITASSTSTLTNKSGNISQWTNDSGYLTSVTAHNLLSSTHGDTLSASVTRGDLIVGNSTPKWARLAIGSANRYVASDGTDIGWSQVSLTAGVSGTLAVANGGTGVTTSTGSTNVVLSDSPTIVTPTIASFANATHTHLNAAGGGTLTSAAISDLATSTVTFSNKSGNISQWTNDSGYVTATSTTTFTNKSGNISQWTNNSGYLTSVTAHNVLSATHGDALAGSVVRGDLIIGNATPKWARLAIGAVGTVLKSDGTDISWNTSTGTGDNVLATSPTLVTPNIGVATGTRLTLSPSGAVGLTITGATETTSQPLLSLTQTWNASGTTFIARDVNITNTASAAASLLDRVQVGGSTVYAMSRLGYLAIGASPPTNFTALISGTLPASTIGILLKQSVSTAYSFFDFYDTSGTRAVFRLDENAALGFGRVGVAGVDTWIQSDAADTLAQRHSTNAQTFRLYNTYTDASNYERCEIKWTSNRFTIQPAHAGTGSARDFQLLTDDGSVLIRNNGNNQLQLVSANYTAVSADLIKIHNGGSFYNTSGGPFASLTINPSLATGSTSTFIYRGLNITPTINYSNATPGGGSYEAIRVAVTETALPTGTNYLFRASAGSAGTTDKFTVTNAGLLSFAGGIAADSGGFKHSRVTTGSVSGGSTALITVTWTTAFADANYTVVASVVDSTTTSLSLSVVHVESVTSSAVTVRVLNNAVGSLTGTLHVIAVHD